MTAILADVKANDTLLNQLKNNRPPNFHFDEILYADDTIIFSTTDQTTEKYSQEIQKAAKRYGLQLNLDKCENINTDPTNTKRISFYKGAKGKKKKLQNIQDAG